MEIQAETLALLEWERLGEQVAGFAGSCLGANLCRPLELAPMLDAFIAKICQLHPGKKKKKSKGKK